MIGVEYELFWTLNPVTIKPFVKAFSLKQTHIDTLMWKQGAYIRLAIGSCLSKDCKYPAQPLCNKKERSIKEIFLERMEIINSRFRKEE